MRLINGDYRHKLHFSELSEITASRALHGLAGAIVGVFVPIYLYELGFTFTEILLYFMLYFLAKALCHLPSAKLVTQIGAKHSLTIAYVLNLFYFAGLYLLSIYTSTWLLLILGIFVGIYASLLLISTHLDLSKAVGKKLGKDLASFYIIITLTVALGPFLGGLIAEEYGASMIYVFAAVVLLFAALPLGLAKESSRKTNIDFKKLNIRRFLAQAPHQVELHVGSVIYSSLWPFYMAIFIFADNPYAAVGFITTIAALAKVADHYIVGKMLDKGNLVNLIRGTSFVNALMHFMRAFILNPIAVVFYNLFSELSKEANFLSYADEFYIGMNHKDKIEHLVAIEVIGDLGKLTFFAVLALLSLIVSIQTTLVSGFIIGGLAYMFMGISAERATNLRY